MGEHAAAVAPYRLPPLPFDYGAFAPVIDAETMRLHHDTHHQSYVDSVNAALAKHPDWLGLTIEDVLRDRADLPDDIRTVVRNQGGGHANHQFFWKFLTPHGRGRPSGELLKAIEAQWGSFEAFKSAFEQSGTDHFGSGWAFLACLPRRGFRLEIVILPNQDSLLLLDEPSPGLLACDLWEHAYYLTYRNRRAEWLKAFWEIVDWEHVAERLEGVHEGHKQL